MLSDYPTCDEHGQQTNRKGEKTVLIIDDEPDMCWALEGLLSVSGFASTTALNGHEALERIRSEHFSLVFLDAKLPDVEGLELAKQIRILNPSVHIVMISGYFYKDDISVQEALSGGLICGFIAKPFLHEDIFRTIDTFLGGQFENGR